MFLGYNVNVFIFVHIDADDDFQVPDWHWPTCQSGTWKTSGSLNGSYTNLGSHRGSFSGRNSGGSTLFIYASGGNGGSAGGACANTSRLQGYV
ncbi:prepilin, shufflon protein A, partial [Salmonella enterica subsp. enterica serovar Infantis]|nr:prepilin, shufflon protein A [Salmonella enterica subsp. enterica serovar Infantis]